MPDAPIAFFSYSHEDSEFALRLAADLKAAGSAVWIDQIDIGPGELWDRKVEEALKRCPSVLVILSPASANSNNVLDEVSYALDQKKSLIPVLYKDCDIPFRLRRLQHVDFRKDYDSKLREVQKCLHPGAPPQTVERFSPSPVTPTPARPVERPPVVDPRPQPRRAFQGKAQPPDPVRPPLGGLSTPAWIAIAVAAVVLLIGIYFLVGSGSGNRSDAEKKARQGNTPIEPLQGGTAAAEISRTEIAHAQTSPPCSLPLSSESDFSVTDPTVWFFFAYKGGSVSDQWTVDWVEPNGYVHKTNNVEHPTVAGHFCFDMTIAGGPASRAPGEWTVRLKRNGTEVAEKKFTIKR